MEERIRNAFDLSRISKEIVAKGALAGVKIYLLSDVAVAEPPQASQGLLYKSRVRTEPTNITAPQFAAALWTRIESLVEEMAGCCIKVGGLSRLLFPRSQAPSSRFIPSRKYSISRGTRSVEYRSSMRLSRFVLTFVSSQVVDHTNIRRLTTNRVLYSGRRWESLWRNTHATLLKVGDDLDVVKTT